MGAGGFIAIFAVLATGAVLWLALVVLADAREHRRMIERLRHQRALADVKPWGDVVELPAAAKSGGGPKAAAGLAQQTMSLTHRGSGL